MEEFVGFENLEVMAPAQNVRHCLTIWETDVELPHIKDVTPAESLSILMREVRRETIEEVAAVFGPLRTVLLVFYNILSDVPISLDQGGVDSCGDFRTSFLQDGSNAFYEVVVP